MGPAGWIESQIHVTQVVFESQPFFYTQRGGGGWGGVKHHWVKDLTLTDDGRPRSELRSFRVERIRVGNVIIKAIGFLSSCLHTSGCGSADIC